MTLLMLAGVVLLAVEANRPGALVPGATGLLALLLGIHGLASTPLHPAGVAAALAGLLMIPLGALRPALRWLSVAGSALLAGGLYGLKSGAEGRVHLAWALLAGVTVGYGLWWLAAVAWLARRNKRTLSSTR
ncbi:MAG: hypothetical protein KGK08_12070 [Acidobacteriota bacterium]|nr:hypothetical protein [Acidobacteriota bacterium]